MEVTDRPRAAGYSGRLRGVHRGLFDRWCRPDANDDEHRKKMKFKCIEFSWRAAFIGIYLTPERDRLWVTIIPFFPLYFKRR
jgi:hypothetical protein